MIVNFSNDEQMMITFNAQAEQVLMQSGYDNMSVDDKNSLLAIISNQDNIAFSDITADYILQHHKKIKVAYLEEQRDNAIHSGFTSTDNHTYRTNPDDQTNMLGQMIKIMRDNTVSTVEWTQQDTNSLASYSVADWENYVFNQAFSFKDSQMVKCNGLVKDVLTATSHDQIIAIKWS